MPIRLSAINIEYVWHKSGGAVLYCALHKCWHDRDSFSPGNDGQQKRLCRYCLRATADERARFDEIASMEPSEAGRREIAAKMGWTLVPAEEAPEAASSRSIRMAEREAARGDAVDGSGDAGGSAAPRQRIASARPSRMRTRAHASAARGRRPPRSANARIMKVWGNGSGRIRAINYSQRVRGCGRAVDLPLCRRMAEMQQHLATLRDSGVLRPARPASAALACSLARLFTGLFLRTGRASCS